MSELNGGMPAAMNARQVLAIPAYRRLWLAQLVSDVGDGLTNLTLLLLVNELTGSTAALAAMAIALAVPPLTIGLVAGTLADRLDRRRLMLGSDLFRAIIVLGFVLIGSAGQLWLLLALALAQSAVGTFFNPARGALLPRLVPPEGLLAANSISQATRVVAGVVGAGLAGVMIGSLGTYWPAFVLDAMTFLASFLLVLGIPAALGRAPERSEDVPSGVRADLVEGLRIVAGSRLLWVTVGTLAVAMLGLGSVNLLFVPLLVNDLRVAEAWFGPVELAQTASMVLAAGLVAALAARISAQAIVVAGMLGIGVVAALLGAVGSVWHVILLVFAVGWFVTPLQAAVVTILQRTVEDRARGRVMAALQAAMSGASVASMAAAGALAQVVGTRTVFFVAGAIVMAAAVLAAIAYRTDARRGGVQPAIPEPFEAG